MEILKAGWVVSCLAVASMSVAAPAFGQGARDVDLDRGRSYLEPFRGEELPTDIGNVSIGSSRRAMRALMRDWRDDSAEIKWRWILSCGVSAAKGALNPFFISANHYNLGVLIFLRNFDHYFPKVGPTSAGRLGQELRSLLRLTRLTAGERATLDRLIERDEHPLDDTDKIRLAIDTQWFLVRVANRVYDERIDYHVNRTKGFWGFFRYEEEMCNAYSVRRERNRTLERAGRAVLDSYVKLERALED